MHQLKYAIEYDEAISRWWITDMESAPFQSPCEAFEAEVNLGEGYVQIIYPVRKEFLKKNNIAAHEYYAGEYKNVYFPFENNRVDFTTFINTPHHIWVHAKTFLEIEETGVYPFEIYTCGGMKIWVNQEEVMTFAPYSRNIPQKCELNLKLKAGLNEVVVYADELAERDVFFYYEFRYKGSKQLTGVLPLETDVKEVLYAENFLKSCYFPKDYFETGKLVLNYDNTLLNKDQPIYVKGDPTGEKLSNINENEEDLMKIAKKEHTEVVLGELTDFNVGVFNLLISCNVGNFNISRNLVVGIIPEDFVDFKPKSTLKERKEQALKFISLHGDNVVNKCMAILEIEHQMTDLAYKCLRNSLEKIKRKEDCADFYLTPMFLLITRYKAYLSEEDYQEIKQAIIDFRYWIDEPGNDVMWYFSENHALLFHISQYLSGYLFEKDTFTASGRKGKEQYQIGKQRLEDRFDIFFKYGYAEWNSATYIPIDLIGFFVLYQMAPDEEIRKTAKEAIDFTFKIVTYNTFNGIMSSSYGRAYEDTLKAREQVEPSFIEWVSYGKGFVNSRGRAVALYCLSDYEPPAYNEEVKLKPGEWMSLEFDQGINAVKTYSYRTNHYFSGSVRRFKPFVHGHQQHIMNVALGKRSVQYYINHPGERPFSGGNRPCYWAGNGTIPYVEQYRNLTVMLYKIDKDELVHYIHTYSPLYVYDEYEVLGKWFFARVDDAYMGTYFSNGITLTSYGANTNKEIISRGLNHGVIVKCGSKEEFGSFEAFKEALKHRNVEYDGKEFIKFNDPQYGVFMIKNPDQVFVNGQILAYEAKPQMEVVGGNR